MGWAIGQTYDAMIKIDDFFCRSARFGNSNSIQFHTQIYTTCWSTCSRRRSHWPRHHFERIIFWWTQVAERQVEAVDCSNRHLPFRWDAILVVQWRQFSTSARYPTKTRICFDPAAAVHRPERKCPIWSVCVTRSLANLLHLYHHRR